MNKEDFPESTRKKGNMVTKMESNMSESFSQLQNFATVVDFGFIVTECLTEAN